MDNPVKQINKLIELQTVKKVEALIKELKSQDKKLRGFIDTAESSVKKAESLMKERKEVYALKVKYTDEAKEVQEKFQEASQDTSNKIQKVKGHESANEGLEKRLREASDALEKGAKAIEVPVPPIVKTVSSVISASQSTRILLEDLRDWE